MSRKVLFLSVLLILLLIMPACGSSGEEEPVLTEATAVLTKPPAATIAPTIQPTNSPAPSPTPKIPLGDEYRSQEGGYAFLTLPKYEVEEFYGFSTMMGPNSDPNAGPAIAFIGGLNEEPAAIDDLFEQFQQEVVGGEGVEIELANQREMTINGLPGRAADLSGSFDGEAVNGRIVVTLVTPTQPFTMFGAAPSEEWEEFAPQFEAVLASVSFFEPVIEANSFPKEPAPVAEALEKPETAMTEIHQWASYAFASSEYSSPDWAAFQATGEPDTPTDECADLPTAWASYENDTAEWIELTYEIPVITTQINIIQTHSPDQVVKVELVDMAGAYQEIYTSEPENLWDECPYTLSIPVDVNYEAVGLKISIDQSVVPTTWNEIDAVELVGLVGEETVVTPPKTENETPAGDGELTVEALSGYQDLFQTWHVVGLLTNHSARAVDDVEVEIEIRDAAGKVLHTEMAWMSLYRIAPGETTPFRLMVYEDLIGVDSFTANIVGQSVAEIERADVEVRGVVRSVDDDGNIHITGELVNNGGEPTAVNNVAAATFDASGEIITADSASINIGYLEPGDSGPFRVYMYGPAEGVDAIVDHMIYVDAVTTEPETDWTTLFSEAVNIYVDRYDDVHVVGEVTNDSADILDLRLLAAFYDVDGNVLDADTFSMPLDLAPGETLPFDIVGGWGALEHTTGLVERVDSYSIQWDPYWTWTSSVITLDLATTNDEQEFGNDTASFTGQIVNDSGVLLDKAIIIVELRDTATGELVATGYDSSFDDLPADDVVDYWVIVDLEPGYDTDNLEYFFIVKGEQS